MICSAPVFPGMRSSDVENNGCFPAALKPLQGKLVVRRGLDGGAERMALWIIGFSENAGVERFLGDALNRETAEDEPVDLEQGDKLVKLTIIRVGEAAKAFESDEAAFQRYLKNVR